MSAYAIIAVLALFASEKPSVTKSKQIEASVLLEKLEITPKGRTVRLDGLPEGVVAMAFGPMTDAGRAVVVVSPRGKASFDDSLEGGEARAWLSNALGARVRTTERFRDPAGVEITSEVVDGERRLVARHRIEGDYVVSVLAPEAEIEATWKLLARAAERLRKSGILSDKDPEKPIFEQDGDKRGSSATSTPARKRD